MSNRRSTRRRTPRRRRTTTTVRISGRVAREALALLLVLLAIVSTIALFAPNAGAIVKPWHDLLAYLLGWGIFTTYMFVGSMRVSGAVAAVFLFLAATFIVLPAPGAF